MERYTHELRYSEKLSDIDGAGIERKNWKDGWPERKTKGRQEKKKIRKYSRK